MHTPKPGEILRSDDGETIVVAEGDEDVIGALIELLGESYGGEFSRENPLIVERAKGLKVDVWRSCTKAYCEAEGIDTGGYWGWWAPNGDGKRTIHVVDFDGSVYYFGQECDEAEQAAANV